MPTHEHWGVMHSLVTALNCCVAFRKANGRVGPGSSHHKKISSHHFLFPRLYMMMNVNQTAVLIISQDTFV